MGEIDVKKLPVNVDEKKLSVDFSQDHDLEAIKAKVLAFLKDDVAESGTVTCVIRVPQIFSAQESFARDRMAVFRRCPKTNVGTGSRGRANR